MSPLPLGQHWRFSLCVHDIVRRTGILSKWDHSISTIGAGGHSEHSWIGRRIRLILTPPVETKEV